MGNGAANSSILDLDRLSISANKTDNLKFLDSMLEEPLSDGILNMPNNQAASGSNTSAATKQANKAALEASALKARMETIKNQNLERKQSNPNSLITSTINSITNVSDEDQQGSLDAAAADTAAAAATAAASSLKSQDNALRLSEELAAMKEREKA
jgi:hypothetical protein